MKKSKPLGGRPGVTLDEVSAACVRLEQAGRIVTTLNVRLELGTGSHTTIQQHLRALGYHCTTRVSRKKT